MNWSDADLARHYARRSVPPAAKRPAQPPTHDRFLLLLEAHGLPLPETEVTFHPTRKWRVDYIWRHALVIVEKDGGIFTTDTPDGKGAHSRPANILRDMEKGNAAQVLGYLFLRFTPQQLASGAALPLLTEVLG